MAKVFISYSKKDYISDNGAVLDDGPVARILSALSAEGISYWIDKEELEAGDVYADKIAKSIKDCDTFLFISTENSNRSEWTLKEISTAITSGKKIVPVRIDHSEYAQSVAWYLSSVQYIDWMELGRDEATRRIIAKIKDVPKITTIALYAGLVVLTGIFAMLTYQFLWSDQLRSNEIMGGLVGYVCEFGVLTSIYYILRLLRRRKCSFVFPAAAVMAVFLAGMMLKDSEIVGISALLLLGWVFLFSICYFIKNKAGKSLLAQPGKEQVLMKWTDAENLILVYLVIKCFILVFAYYFGLSMGTPLFSTYLF